MALVVVSRANSVVMFSFDLAPCPGSTGISVEPFVEDTAELVVVVISSFADALFLVKKPGSGGKPFKFVLVERQIFAASRKEVVEVVMGMVVNE